jgi:two-component system nitrate/nitrite response regulator NarL
MSQPAVSLPRRLDRIKVLAAESTRMNGQLLAAALAQDRQLEIIGVARKSPSILAAVAQQRPHVVLISSAFEDSGTQSFDLARQISAAGKGTRVIFLMDTSSPANAVQAFRCGAHGIFSRGESSKSLAKCIHSVHQAHPGQNC